jgi:hypothetical protein
MISRTFIFSLVLIYCFAVVFSSFALPIASLWLDYDLFDLGPTACVSDERILRQIVPSRFLINKIFICAADKYIMQQTVELPHRYAHEIKDFLKQNYLKQGVDYELTLNRITFLTPRAYELFYHHWRDRIFNLPKL